jgi:hypothetical protein
LFICQSTTVETMIVSVRMMERARRCADSRTIRAAERASSWPLAPAALAGRATVAASGCRYIASPAHSVMTTAEATRRFSVPIASAVIPARNPPAIPPRIPPAPINPNSRLACLGSNKAFVINQNCETVRTGYSFAQM